MKPRQCIYLFHVWVLILLATVTSIAQSIPIAEPVRCVGCIPVEVSKRAVGGSSEVKLTNAFFETLVIACTEDDPSRIGFLVTAFSVFTYDRGPKKTALSGVYLSFSKNDLLPADASLSAALNKFEARDPAINRYFSLTDFLVDELRKTDGFERLYALTPSQTQELLRDEPVDLVIRYNQHRQPTEWLVSRQEKLPALSSHPYQSRHLVLRRTRRNRPRGRVRNEEQLPSSQRQQQLEEERRCQQEGCWTDQDGVLHVGGYPVQGNGIAGGAGGNTQGPSDMVDAHQGLSEIVNDIGNLDLQNPDQSSIDQIRQKFTEWAESVQQAGQRFINWVKSFFPSFGDPHLITFDKEKYDFQAVGEFILAKSTTDQFEVQTRQASVSGDWPDVTRNIAVGLHTGSDRLNWGLGGMMFLNGQPLSMTLIDNGPYVLPGGSTLTKRFGSIVVVATAAGDSILVQDRTSSLNVFVKPANSRRSNLIGLLGDFDGDRTNDGRVRTTNAAVNLANPDALYPTFADSWRIRQSESLLYYPTGTTTETYTDRTKPTQTRPIATLDVVRRQQAAIICDRAGVRQEPERCNCLLDVALTGNTDYAAATAGISVAIPSDRFFARQADFPGPTRSYPVLQMLDGKVYMGLGESRTVGNGAVTRQTDWWQYDPTTDEWLPKAPFPGKARLSQSSFIAAGKVFVGLGADPTDSRAHLKDWWAYDPLMNQWSRISDMPGPGRILAGTFSLQNKGYVFLGRRNQIEGAGSEYIAPMYAYDPVTNAWTVKSPYPGTEAGLTNSQGAFNNMSIFNLNEKGYVGRGNTSRQGRFWEYNPTTDQWTDGGEQHRYSTTGQALSFVLNGKGYAPVGSLNQFGQYQIVEWQFFDPATFQWTVEKTNPYFLTGSSSATKVLPVSDGQAAYYYQADSKLWWQYIP